MQLTTAVTKGFGVSSGLEGKEEVGNVWKRNVNPSAKTNRIKQCCDDYFHRHVQYFAKEHLWLEIKLHQVLKEAAFEADQQFQKLASRDTKSESKNKKCPIEPLKGQTRDQGRWVLCLYI